MSDRFDYLELDNKPLRAPRREAPVAAPSPAVAPTRPPAPRASAWRIVEVIGGPGSRIGQFASPSGLAVDSNGNLYVADSYNHRIQRITPAGDVYALGKRGTGPGEFLNPQAIVSDGGLGFYVLDQGTCRIQHFGRNGEWIEAFGSRGSGRGQMLAPMAMARGPAGALFVADTGNNRIVKWTAEGFWILDFGFWIADRANESGGRTSSPAQSKIQNPKSKIDTPFRPHGIAVDHAGRIWVAEAPRHRLLVFDALFRVIGSHGEPGEEEGQFQEPQGLAVTPSGCLLVADSGNDRVQILDAEGRPIQVVGSRDAAAVQAGCLNSPSSLAARGEEEAYVADTGNHRVLRLARK